MKMTSAYANKLMKSLEENKTFLLNKEQSSCTYVASINEEPVVPDYDYSEVAAEIAAIDEKIAVIKHAVNLNNATARVPVGDSEMSIDTILIRMAQLNRRKSVLDNMRKRLPKSREASFSVKATPEYRYINYDMRVVERDYMQVSEAIMEMQMALDRYNQMTMFDVEI